MLHRLALVPLLFLAGCYPSNVLDESLRGVHRSEAPSEWFDVDPASFPGSYFSESIEGEAAAGMIELRYIFSRDGSYTGAALVMGVDNPHFQTLDGTWALAKNYLTLDGEGPGFPLSGNGNLIRIIAPSGTVVLRRTEIQ